MNIKIDVQMNFCRLFPFIERKKVNPGISRDGDQFCPVIPGYGKALKILNPNAYWFNVFSERAPAGQFSLCVCVCVVCVDCGSS